MPFWDFVPRTIYQLVTTLQRLPAVRHKSPGSFFKPFHNVDELQLFKLFKNADEFKDKLSDSKKLRTEPTDSSYVGLKHWKNKMPFHSQRRMFNATRGGNVTFINKARLPNLAPLHMSSCSKEHFEEHYDTQQSSRTLKILKVLPVEDSAVQYDVVTTLCYCPNCLLKYT